MTKISLDFETWSYVSYALMLKLLVVDGKMNV